MLLLLLLLLVYLCVAQFFYVINFCLARHFYYNPSCLWCPRHIEFLIFSKSFAPSKFRNEFTFLIIVVTVYEARLSKYS